MAATAAGVIFLRFRRETGDRLFAYFAIAFWLLAASWTLLGIATPSAENRPYVYALRLIAFVLIISAIVDKSRSGSR
jgi:hypothetical protein